MAPRTTRAAKAAPAPEPEEVQGKDYAAYIEKDATPTQARMIDWLQSDEVGYDPATAKTKAEAFFMGAKLVFALRMEFQRSPFNQEYLEERRQELEAAKAGTNAAAPKKVRATRKAKAEEPEPEEEDEEDFEDEGDDIVEDEEETPPPAPVKRATRTTRAAKAAAAATEAPATKPVRRTRAKSSAAPF